MSFLFTFMQMMTILLARVEWLYDWIEVPLYANIENYRYLPEAKLYIDDQLVINPKTVYERNGVEYTFISTVNTSYVRTYHMRYRVHFPEYNLYDVHTISFDVVDLIAPTIIHIPTRTIAIGEKLPDFNEGVLASDNYAKNEELNIYVDLKNVSINQVGNYTITYHVSDPSGNVVMQDVIFQIIDPIPPTMILNKPIIIDVHTAFVWQNFIKITDNVDLVVEVVIMDDLVKYDQLGSYQITIMANDRSQNQHVETFTIEITDRIAPIIKVKNNPSTITAHTPITRELLESYLLEVSDNYTALDFNHVIISHDINPLVIGKYQIYYSVLDEMKNKTEVNLSVFVVDDIRPQITLIKPLVYDVFSPEPFWIEHFEFTDNYTPNDRLLYKITQTVKMNMIGRYMITIEVTDSSGNKTIYQDYIWIMDSKPPVITQLNDVVITDFEKKSLNHYFSVTDQYYSADHIVLIIDDASVNYEIVGTYQATVQAMDPSMNMTFYSFEIWVIDIEEPKLSLKQQNYVHQLGHQPIDLYQFILEVSDNYDELSIHDVLINHEIIWNQVGVYHITYTIQDHAFNNTSFILMLTIDDRIPPLIVMEDLVIEQGDTLDLWQGVEITDQLETNLYCFPHTIDTNTPGSIVVTYVAVDQRGNYTQSDRLITIHPEENTYSWIDFIPLAVINLIGGLIIFIIYKKQ